MITFLPPTGGLAETLVDRCRGGRRPFSRARRSGFRRMAAGQGHGLLHGHGPALVPGTRDLILREVSPSLLLRVSDEDLCELHGGAAPGPIGDGFHGADQPDSVSVQ